MIVDIIRDWLNRHWPVLEIYGGHIQPKSDAGDQYMSVIGTTPYIYIGNTDICGISYADPEFFNKLDALLIKKYTSHWHCKTNTPKKLKSI